jgi:hypothetical protein
MGMTNELELLKLRNKNFLEYFIVKHDLHNPNKVSNITKKELEEIEKHNYTVEILLQYLATAHKYLLHGSRTNIKDNFLKSENVIFGTFNSKIAIMKAIVSNNTSKTEGLEYPFHLNQDNPLIVKIHGIKKNTIGNEGFVYIIKDTDGFVNEPKGSWQYIKKSNKVKFVAKIFIERNDLKCPIYDIDNNKRIQ